MDIQRFTSRSTKSAILKAYNDLAKAYKDLEAKSGGSSPAPAAAPSAPSKPKPAPGGGLDVAGVIAQLSTLSDRIGESAGSLQQKLTVEATRLEELTEQSEASVKRLAELHELEFGEGTLDHIIAEYNAAREEHDGALTAKKEAFQKDIAAKREAWRKEQDEHGREVRERMIELKKTRTRDAQEYRYELDLKRAAEDDEFAQTQKAFEQKLQGAREAKETDWAAREKAVAEREQEFTELKDKDENFKEWLEKAVKAAESQGMNVARRETKVQADLLAKEHEGRERVYKLRVKSLEETLSKQSSQIDSLSSQLEATNKRAQDLAVRAIEGASNAASFKAIQDIAMEQAKNTGKGK
ncbi:MAG: hypothetical protein H6713_34255 [Myxococcales bacterium]|nr:hypothetical protein [Myxococcales bacterium]MCB9755028.1 hypothetical protein [Myxococcales bacterium]